MNEQTVAAEAGGVEKHGGGRGGELAGDLAEAGAAEEAVEQWGEQVGALEPIGKVEGLVAEVAVAVSTLVTLDTLRWTAAREETGTDEAPARVVMVVEVTAIIGAKGGYEGVEARIHAPLHRTPQAICILPTTTGATATL